MSLLRWFTRNVADTSVPTHADLKPLPLPGPLPLAIARIRAAVEPAKLWAVESDSGDAALHLTHKTGVMGYTDDVWLTLVETGDMVTVNARSQSRVGTGDLGQNRRNILELWRIVRAAGGKS